MVQVVEPAPVTVVGEKVAVAPLGNPDVVKETTPLKPLIAVTVTVVDPDFPCRMLNAEGEADSEKSGGFDVVITSVTELVWVIVPSVPCSTIVYVPVGVLGLVITVPVV